jgi:acetyl esterase/lipase
VTDRRRRRWYSIVLAMTVAAAGCTSSEAPTTASTTLETDQPATHGVVDMFLPPTGTTGPGTLIVLVPGGGWVSADPAGMVPLANELARHGAIVATTTYRTSAVNAHFPTPVEDVACAVAEAAATAEDEGYEIGTVVILGHSAGAQLAALVALEPDTFGTGCQHPLVRPDALIGLAGPYDVTLAADAASELFGPFEEDPANWTDGNPQEMTTERRSLDVLLMHGTADRTVPIHFTDAFGQALVAGGHDVAVIRPDGVDHQSIYTATVAAAEIIAWLGL